MKDAIGLPYASMSDDKIITVNTDDIMRTEPKAGVDLAQRRIDAYSIYDNPGMPECSIIIQGYNRLERTKYAVECVLKYTQDVDFELILIDNGSDDGTLGFFKSVDYEPKHVIHITKNLGAFFPWKYASSIAKGRYLVSVPNDVYVTKNWLSNLLKCYESDPRIGFVEPVSSNVSNRQQVDLEFSTFDEMQEKAAEYNISDPSKWEERLKLVSILGIYSRHVLDTIGCADCAFIHEFAEDDVAARLRYNGYKLILCRDTWVCHDHNFRGGDTVDIARSSMITADGYAIFKDKYHGIEPFDDINNFEQAMLSPLDSITLNGGELSFLAVDPRCGTPVLEIRNHLRKRGITQSYSCAYTTQAKYFDSLQYAADNACCDRIDFIQTYYLPDMFDIITLCEPLNIYSTPVTLLQSLCMLLKPGGVLLFKLRNTYNIYTLLKTIGMGDQYDEDLPVSLSEKEVLECLNLFGMENTMKTTMTPLQHTQEEKYNAEAVLKALNPNAQIEDIQNILAKDFSYTAYKRQ